MRKKTKKKQKSNRQKAYHYLQEYKKRFGVEGFKYTLIFVRGEKAKGYYAEVVMTRNKIKMYVNEDLMDADPSAIHDTIVHELLHVVFYKLMDRTTNIITRHVRRAITRKKLELNICGLEHKIIEKLAPAFVKYSNKKNMEKN